MSDQIDGNESCPTCNRPFDDAKKGTIVFDKFMAAMFAEVLKRTEDRRLSWTVFGETKSEFVIDSFLQQDFRLAGLTSFYTRLSDLKHWGLIDQRTEWRHQGIYRVTPLGLDFVSRGTAIPRSLILNKKSGEIYSTDGIVTFREAAKDIWPTIAVHLDRWSQKVNIESKELF